MKLYTSRYQNKVVPDSGLIPVGITLGYPRFIRYPLGAFERRLAPDRSYFYAEAQVFEEKYLAKLDYLGEGVLDILTEIRDRFPESAGLALLCYEDVRLSGESCHRQLLAGWLNQNFGLDVGELPDPSPVAGARDRTPVKRIAVAQAPPASTQQLALPGFSVPAVKRVKTITPVK
jgi:hypothetical protein